MRLNDFLLNGFAEKLYITQEDIQSVRKYEYEHKSLPLKKILAELNLMVEKDFNKAVASVFNVQYLEINPSELSADLIDKTPKVYINENRVIPYKRLENLLVAIVDDPVNFIKAHYLQTIYSLPVSICLVSEESMEALLKHIDNVSRREKALTDLAGEDITDEEQGGDGEKYISAPAVSLANTLLQEAVEMGASDIHIEPMEDRVRVRFRIDGVLQEHCDIASNLFQSLLARYKIMSQMDIAERRIPQDGKLSLVIGAEEFDFRISTLPNIYGEKIVIRVYNTLGDKMTVSKLTTNKSDETKIRNLINSPNGIILLTGPTGSGKTTTLYAFLKELNTVGVNIQTVEDPVENQVEGVNQLQVNPKTGLTFASALRSILRQDPDVVMVGEIRDEETAHIAVQAAITGHLVLSTLHTNDATTTIPRLVDMGVEPYLVADSLMGSISQRLMRKLCPHCKKEHRVTDHEGKLLGIKPGTIVYEPGGCNRCNGTGYSGRVAVFEILSMAQNVREAIDERKFGYNELEEAAIKDGLVPLRVGAAQLVEKGLSSIDEFNGLVSHIGEE